MYARPFTKEIEKKARDELNETPAHREEFLRKFREWIETEYRVQLRTEGLWLLNYVRGCKYCNQTVKKKFTNFIKLETAAPEIFANRDPLLPEIQEILRKGAIIPFGTPDKECVLIKWDVFEFDKIDFYDVIKVAIMVLDVFMNENDTCMVIGHYVIIDFKGFSMSLLKQLTPFTLKKVFYNVFLSYPCRIKALYFVNCPGYVQTLFSLVKPFISQKLGSRASFYGENFDEVFSVIPRRYLPTEYGGNDESISDIIGNWKMIIEGYRDWFLEDLTNSNDRSRVKDKNIYNSYDIQGSFKKLDID